MPRQPASISTGRRHVGYAFTRRPADFGRKGLVRNLTEWERWRSRHRHRAGDGGIRRSGIGSAGSMGLMLTPAAPAAVPVSGYRLMSRRDDTHTRSADRAASIGEHHHRAPPENVSRSGAISKTAALR